MQDVMQQAEALHTRSGLGGQHCTRVRGRVWDCTDISCASTCSWQIPAMVPCSSIRKTPAATAASHSARSRPLAAR